MSVWPLSMSIQCSVNQKKKAEKKKESLLFILTVERIITEHLENYFWQGKKWRNNTLTFQMHFNTFVEYHASSN